MKDYGWLIHSAIAVAIMVAGWYSGDLFTSLMTNCLIWLPREIMQHPRRPWKVFTDGHVASEWLPPVILATLLYFVLGMI